MSPRKHSIRTTLALTMALGAVAPAAHARLAVDPVAPPASSSAKDIKSAQDLGRAVQPSPAKDIKSAHDLQGVAGTSSLAGTADTRHAVITLSSPSGFDWGDAAIGAAGGLGLALAAVGGTLVVGRRRHTVTRGLVS